MLKRRPLMFFALVFAIGALLTVACVKEVSTTETTRPKEMKIRLEAASGKELKVVDENDNPATPVDKAEMDRIYQSQAGFKYVGVILYTKSSPGCTYVVIGDRTYKVCF